MALEIKTPGVFIRELNAIPNAIVGVETAVPVFVGYTEIANKDGHPVTLVPTPIGSVAEYSRIFGSAYQASFQGEPAVDGDADFLAGGQGYKLSAGKNFNLYDSIRLFYANGGGHCFIVSTGSYADDLAQRASTLQAGLAAVHDLAGPTMLVIPEATLLELKDYRTLRQAMLKQCFDKQDRVAILDVIGTDRLPPTAGGGNPPASPKAVEDYLHDKVADFRDGLDAAPESLKYGMAYAPFLETSLVAASDFSFDNFDSSSRQTVTTVVESEIDRLYPAPDSRGQSL